MRSRVAPLLLLVALMLMASKCEYLSQPYFDRLEARASVGDLPDVGYVEAYRAPSYIERGMLQDLENSFEEAISNSDPALLSFFQRDGGTYAIPRDFQTLALLVNKDLLQEVGVDQPPQTWEEMYAVSANLRAVGSHGIGLSPSFWNFLPFVFQAGGSFVSEEGRRVSLVSDESLQAMEFFVSLAIDGGLVIEETLDDPLAGFPYRPTRLLVEAFGEGEVAMIIAPNVTYEFLSGQDMGFEMVVAELPAGPAGRSTLPYVTGFGIHSPDALDNPDVGSFLEFLVGSSGQEIWASSAIYMPANPLVRDVWLDLHPDAAPFLAGVEYVANYQPAFSSFEAIEGFDRSATEILAAALKGEIDSSSAIRALAETAEAMIRG